MEVSKNLLIIGIATIIVLSSMAFWFSRSQRTPTGRSTEINDENYKSEIEDCPCGCRIPLYGPNACDCQTAKRIRD